MKIYNEEIKMKSAKIIVSQSPFQLVHNICINNETIVIAPWTKLADLFNYKKNNFLANMINEKFEDLPTKMLNNELILKTINEIESKYNFNFLDFDERSNKIIKDHFVVSKDLIDINNIVNVIKYVNRFSRMKTNIVLVGFENLAMEFIKLNLDNINILIVANSLRSLKIDMKYIECLILQYNNDELLQIFDIDILKSWLENKTQISLTYDDINSYFKNIINNNTIMIEKVIQNL